MEIETASENDFLKRHLQSIGATSKQSFNQTYMLCQQEQELFGKNPTPLKPFPEGRTNFANVCVISNYYIHRYVRLVLFSPFIPSNNFALLNSFGSVHIHIKKNRRQLMGGGENFPVYRSYSQQSPSSHFS